MKKIFCRIIISAMALLLVTGCKTGGIKSRPVAADNILSMPNDASRVVLAISAKILNNEKQIKNVAFRSVDPVRLPYANLFNFEKSILLVYNKEARSLKAELFFRDTLGRTCTFSVAASYSVNGSNITINKYRITEKYFPAENSVCFIFPAKEYKQFKKSTLPKSFYSLYKYAATRAVTTQQASKYSGKREWTVMVFVLDRMDKSYEMKLELSDKKGELGNGHDIFSKYIIYSGWRVGVVTGKFHLLEPGSAKPLYAKVFCGSGSGFANRIKMIGSYKLR